MTEGRRKIFIRDAHTHTQQSRAKTHEYHKKKKFEQSWKIKATIEQVEQKSAKHAEKYAMGKTRQVKFDLMMSFLMNR